MSPRQAVPTTCTIGADSTLVTDLPAALKNRPASKSTVKSQRAREEFLRIKRFYLRKQQGQGAK
jgi:hypothetical protein